MPLPFQIETYRNFLGLQTKKALTDFLKEESPSCIGGYFDITGAFTKRRGGTKYNFDALGDQITGIYDFRFNNDTDQRLLITSGEDIYRGNGGTPVSIQSGQTPNTFYDFATYDDLAWIVNGADDLLKYDGTDVTQGSIDPPLGNPTLAPDVNGTLPNGTYQVAVTFINALGHESNPAFPFASITLAGVDDEIALTNIPTSTDPQVTGRRIYMSDTDGGTLFFNFVINDNVTTVGSIQNLSTGALLEFDHDPAPDGLIGIEVHKDRLFGFKDNRIFFSNAFDVWEWPQGILDAEKNFVIEVDNSDPITGIKSFFDFLIIFKRDDIFILSGDNELTFRIDRVRADERVGAVSNRAIDVIGNYCYFLGINSCYRTNGITVDDVGENIGDFFENNTASTQFKVNKNLMQDSCSVYFKELNMWLVFTVTAASFDNNMCFYMDTNSVVMDPTSRKVSAKWAPWPGFIATQSVAIVVENGFDVWFRGDDLGFVFRQETIDGDGSNVTSISTGGNGATTLNDTNQNFTVDSLIGLRINIHDGFGEGQERRIVSNTATEITVGAAWTDIPDDTSEYCIGGPFYHYEHAWQDYGNPSVSKRWRYCRLRFQTAGDYTVTVFYAYDFEPFDRDEAEAGIVGQSLWDVALWDVDTWDGIAIYQDRLSLPHGRIHRWSNFKVENNKSGQPVSYLGFDKIYQVKGIR